MTNYKPGDVITLEHEDGSRLVRELKCDRFDDIKFFVMLGEHSWEWLENLISQGWRVTGHKPKNELPTVPGRYEDVDGALWVVNSSGVLHDEDGDYRSDAPHYAPFTRLVPEGSEREAAIREVLAYLKAHLGVEKHRTLDDAADVFGITE